ncbi:MAG: hypothetical protein MOGMAGMI_00216 [Candidatus Omnitrophica bacterium]|nr:hypothetical protein [Candidatus Omnitrophota bacterium]
MKKALIVFVVLIVLVLIAVGVFIATLDLNRYRPLIQDKVRELTGYELEIGGIGLAYQGGLALSVQDIRLAAKAGSEPFANIGRVAVNVDVASLIARSPRVTAVRIERPVLRIERGSDGRFNFEVEGKAPSTTTAPTASSGAAGAASLAIDVIALQDARIEYTDRSLRPERTVEVSDLDLQVRDIAPGKPLKFEGAAAVLGRSQNVRVSGQVSPPAGDTIKISGLTLDTDLEKIDYDKAIVAAPELRELVRAGWKGKLRIELSEMTSGADLLKDLEARVQLDGGRLELSVAPLPLEDIKARIVASGGRIRVEEMAALFAGGRLGVAALADLNGPAPAVQCTINALDLDVSRLLSAGVSRQVMSGRLSGLFEGATSGSDAAAVTANLTGGGQLSLRDGVVHDFNLIREIVQKMSVLPGASESLERRLPPAYRQRLEQSDTRLGPIDVPFTVAQGRVDLPQLVFAAEDFGLRGAATLHPGNILQARAAVELSPGWSQSIVGAVDAAKYFLNARGLIELPATLDGPLSKLKIVPDLGQATQKFVADQGQKLLSDLLSKKDGASGAAQDGGQSQAGSGEDQLQGLIKNFL